MTSAAARVLLFGATASRRGITETPRGYSIQTELDGCLACSADWKAIDVSHGPACPKNRLDAAIESPDGILVQRCFRILNAKNIGVTITLADITEEEFRVLELVEAERQEQYKNGDDGARVSR